MNRRTWLIPLLALAVCSPTPAFSIRPGGLPPPPKNWTETSEDGRFVFVMGEPGGDEAKIASPASSDYAKARSFPQSGLYRVADRQLIWATDVTLERSRSFCYHHVRVLNDGEHVVWFYHAPHGPTKVPRKSWFSLNSNQVFFSSGPRGDFTVERKLTGVHILARGRSVGLFTPDDLGIQAGKLHDWGYGHKPWIEAVDFVGSEMVLTTLDEQRLTFDRDSGELVRRESLGAPLWPLVAVVGGIVLLLTAAAVLLRKPRSLPTAEGDGV